VSSQAADEAVARRLEFAYHPSSRAVAGGSGWADFGQFQHSQFCLGSPAGHRRRAPRRQRWRPPPDMTRAYRNSTRRRQQRPRLRPPIRLRRLRRCASDMWSARRRT